MKVEHHVDVERVDASEWRASLIRDGEVRVTARGHTCPDAINALHYRMEERDGPLLELSDQ